MEPILGDYLTHPQNGKTCAVKSHNKLFTNRDADKEAEELTAIREAYLPQLILAFHSALQSAAFLISREHLLQSLDLANDVAANEELTRCFVASGRMGELVDAFALSSKAMLQLNEQPGGSSAKKRRGRQGETLDIWDVVLP